MSKVKNLLFLGYGRDETRLIGQIELKGVCVQITNKVFEWFDEYDLVVSFGYRHIIKADQIKRSTAPIINLHISYLPWNKGSHPNFWSHYDSTPTGVSIHLVDEGIDTGPIIFQKYVNIDTKKFTFENSHRLLVDEIEDLFIDNLDKILRKTAQTCEILK